MTGSDFRHAHGVAVLKAGPVWQHLFWETEQRPDLIAVAVGMFADPDFERPCLSVWERRKFLDNRNRPATN